MINYTRMLALSLLLAFAASGPCAAQSPVGEWLVKDRTAHIRIVDCDSTLWGVISWVDAPDTDKNNPDPAKRNRPVLGLPILLSMQQATQGEWDGKIYNAQNGKIYTGNIRLKAENTLHVEGCVLGILCGGEDWARLPPVVFKQIADTICRQVHNE